ncbi:MAG: hypothetical protein EWM72_02120 [Nitrospira sp.]|nr:MAG: hypothetical protein EWM72_02120 [Nitrospira sp.]
MRFHPTHFSEPALCFFVLNATSLHPSLAYSSQKSGFSKTLAGYSLNGAE